MPDRLDLDALEERYRVAKSGYPGTWEADGDAETVDSEGDYAGQWVNFGPRFRGIGYSVPMDNTGGGMCDARALCEFIAEIGNAAPALIRRARLAERMAKALRWTLEHHKAALASKPHVATHSISYAESVLREWDAENGDME